MSEGVELMTIHGDQPQTGANYFAVLPYLTQYNALPKTNNIIL